MSYMALIDNLMEQAKLHIKLLCFHIRDNNNKEAEEELKQARECLAKANNILYEAQQLRKQLDGMKNVKRRED